MIIRTLIVDDEPLARQRIRLLARDEPDLEILGECACGPDALVAVERDAPDLLFLDVQMPEMDGFELLQRLPREQLPVVIFTTAYDRHAVRAFETHALDYLLKPLQPGRFKAAVARAHEYLANRQASTAARGLLDLLAARQVPSAVSASTPYLTRLTIKGDDKVVVIKTADIDSIESAGNYVAVHVGKESHILRETLNALETQLVPEKFLRVSRSTIVNLDRVKELQPMFKGEHVIVLQSGKRLTMTRGLLREVEQALKFR
ncbi:MAG TPA: LytTR family DNA-binding domain-containing protein [Candidatus Limnocylindria bacterium]|jgi:two-component system LytT family response regulator|nr:LytTR family DNA-binding domain-containing protein [Candidatus Limnocylindria bacterium]